MTTKSNTIPQTMEAALLAWQRTKPTVPKKGKAQYGKYSKLEDVMLVCDTAEKFGIVYYQENNFEVHDGLIVEFIVTHMIHEPSGKERISRTLVKVKDITNPQAMGSGITYAKRYGLQAMFGLASDDDGNDATGSASANNTAKKRLTRTNDTGDF